MTFVDSSAQRGETVYIVCLFFTLANVNGGVLKIRHKLMSLTQLSSSFCAECFMYFFHKKEHVSEEPAGCALG